MSLPDCYNPHSFADGEADDPVLEDEQFFGKAPQTEALTTPEMERLRRLGTDIGKALDDTAGRRGEERKPGTDS